MSRSWVQAFTLQVPRHFRGTEVTKPPIWKEILGRNADPIKGKGRDRTMLVEEKTIRKPSVGRIVKTQ